MTPLDNLYASLEDGDAPLSVVADWYEENGHELAEGVRWLAENGRMPSERIELEPGEKFGLRWWHCPPSHLHLSMDVEWRLPFQVASESGDLENVGFETLIDAIHHAAEAALKWLKDSESSSTT